jgi:hypothetical protein
MYLAELRWLEGFAADGRWYVVGGEPREVAVDGLALARARRVANFGRLLARTRPSFTLARLRTTRPRGVHHLEDERGDRLAVVALALETLNRPKQAITLYRRALADASWLEDELRPRLDALEAG